jgi:hypothetical protein
MTRRREPKWKAVYARAVALATKGKSMLYDRIKLLASVYEDDEFHRNMREAGTNPETFLQEALPDHLTTFSEFHGLFRACPGREAWVRGDLRAMLASAKQGLRERERTADQAAAPADVAARQRPRVEKRRRVSWKMYVEVLEKCAALEQINAALEKRNAALEEQNEQIRKDYRALQRALDLRDGAAPAPSGRRTASQG